MLFHQFLRFRSNHLLSFHTRVHRLFIRIFNAHTDVTTLKILNKGSRSVWIIGLDYPIPVRINRFLTILTTDKPIRDEGKNSSLKVCKSI